MNNYYFILLLVLLWSVPLANGEQIQSIDEIIDPDSYKHIQFSIVREITINIAGSSDNYLDFLVLDDTNYQRWLDLLEYQVIFNSSLLGDFEFEFLLSQNFNATINMLIINNQSIAVSIELIINENITQTSSSPMILLPFIFTGALVLIIRRKALVSI